MQPDAGLGWAVSAGRGGAGRGGRQRWGGRKSPQESCPARSGLPRTTGRGRPLSSPKTALAGATTVRSTASWPLFTLTLTLTQPRHGSLLSPLSVARRCATRHFVLEIFSNHTHCPSSLLNQVTRSLPSCC